MKRAILLTHLFVKENESYKLDIVNLCVEYFRKYNSDDYIVITGHGLKPRSSTIDMCDNIHWCSDIIYKEINVGHPKLVNIGFDIIRNEGISKICKARLDSVHLIPNITKFCDDIITKENTKKLITTTNNHNYLMGDLFTYGDVDFLKQCWKYDTWYPTKTGLKSLGENFVRAIGGTVPKKWDRDNKLYKDKTWHDLLTEYTSYRNPETLKWIDFRKHWKTITSIPNYKDRILNNDLDYNSYLWKDWPQESNTYPYTEEIFYGG